MSSHAASVVRGIVAALTALLLNLTAASAVAGDADAPPKGAPSSQPPKSKASSARKAARALLQAGMADARRGAFEAALAKFERAYVLYPSHNLLVNIGTTAFQLGRNVVAIEAYSRYLRHPKADEERVNELNQLLPSLYRRVGGITVQVNRPDATVLLDGRPIEWTKGTWIWVEPGEHALVARRPNMPKQVELISVGRGDRLSLKLVLQQPPDSGPPPRPTESYVTLAFVGGGLAAAAAAIALLTGAITLDSQAAKHCLRRVPERCDVEGVSFGDLAKRYERAAIATSTVGLASFASAIIIHVSTREPSKPSLDVGLRPSLDGAAITLTTSF